MYGGRSIQGAYQSNSKVDPSKLIKTKKGEMTSQAGEQYVNRDKKLPRFLAYQAFVQQVSDQ